MMTRRPANTHSSEAGFAIAALMFVLALIGILAGILAAGGSDFSIAGSTDRTSAMIASQADLIRNVINQCNIDYSSSLALCQTSGNCSMSPASDPYPTSGASGTNVSSLICNPLNTQSIWTQTMMPQALQGFADWTYLDAGDAGGRCIWTQPTPIGPSYSTRADIVNGLSKAASKFSNAPANDGTSQVNYDPAGIPQKFVFWITLPSGAPDSHCTP